MNLEFIMKGHNSEQKVGLWKNCTCVKCRINNIEKNLEKILERLEMPVIEEDIIDE